jgi:hypothetical protein
MIKTLRDLDKDKKKELLDSIVAEILAFIFFAILAFICFQSLFTRK